MVLEAGAPPVVTTQPIAITAPSNDNTAIRFIEKSPLSCHQSAARGVGFSHEDGFQFSPPRKDVLIVVRPADCAKPERDADGCLADDSTQSLRISPLQTASSTGGDGETHDLEMRLAD